MSKALLLTKKCIKLQMVVNNAIHVVHRNFWQTHCVGLSKVRHVFKHVETVLPSFNSRHQLLKIISYQGVFASNVLFASLLWNRSSNTTDIGYHKGSNTFMPEWQPSLLLIVAKCQVINIMMWWRQCILTRQFTLKWYCFPSHFILDNS